MVVILLNFEILGEMEVKSQTSSSSADVSEKSKPVQNENIEPEENRTNSTASNAKKFFNKKDATSPPTKNSTKIVEPPQSAAAAAPTQSGQFNGFKVFGISSLNPYQNK